VVPKGPAHVLARRRADIPRANAFSQTETKRGLVGDGSSQRPGSWSIQYFHKLLCFLLPAGQEDRLSALAGHVGPGPQLPQP
jgi:hypothetical protein